MVSSHLYRGVVLISVLYYTILTRAVLEMVWVYFGVFVECCMYGVNRYTLIPIISLVSVEVVCYVNSIIEQSMLNSVSKQDRYQRIL